LNKTPGQLNQNPGNNTEPRAPASGHTRATELPASKRLASRYLAILIASLCLLAAVLEVSVRFELPRVSRVEARMKAEYNASLALRSGGEHKSVLVAGTSLLLTDVDFPKVQTALAPEIQVSRYTVEQTRYLDWYYGLRLWYAKGASADVVLVCLNSRQTISDLVRGDYFAYTMMRTADFWSASRAAKLSPTDTFSLLLGSVSAFYGTRTETRKVLLGRFVPGVNQVARMVAPPQNRILLEYGPATEVITRRLSQMRALVSGHRGRLIFLAPATRDAADLSIFLAAGARAGVTVMVPLEVASVLPSDFKDDGFHLNEAGAAKYTDALIPQLRQVIAD
jgi:hypothetical protein